MANGRCSETCDKCQDLSAKLLEQMKVNSELKNLLVGALGSDVGMMVESLAKDKLLLDRELSDYKNQIERGADDIDNLTAQADTWRSKYLAVKIGFREIMTSKTTALQQLEELRVAVEGLMADQDRLWACTAGTYSVLAGLCKQSAQGLCFIPEKPPHGSVVHIAEVNQKLARCLMTVFGKSSASPSLLEKQPIAEPTPAARKAANILASLRKPGTVNGSPIANGIGNRDFLVERFHPSVRLDSDIPLLCRGCKGNVIIL